MTQKQSDPPQEEGPSAELRARSTGAFKDYLLGLDHVRRLIIELDTEKVKALTDFYRSPSNDEEECNQFLCQIKDCFETANDALRQVNKETVVVDGQIPIATLINNVKISGAKVDAEVFTSLTEFWENLKFSIEALQIVSDKFEKNVLSRLRTSCISYDAALGDMTPDNLKLPRAYTMETQGYLSEMEATRSNFRLVAASCGNRINKTLISKSTLLNRLLKGIDKDQYPVLQTIPDLTHKVETLFRLARLWLDRDETYLFDVSQEIRETKSRTREKEEVAKLETVKQQELVRQVKTAFLLCQNSKRRLREIAAELTNLEEQVESSAAEYRSTLVEKSQKDGLSDFLQISITQTRRNYNLQLKRQKLQRQVRELEKSLVEVEQHISTLKEEIVEVATKKKEAMEKFSSDERAYSSMKVELETFSKHVEQIHTELAVMRKSLAHLEAIQTVKTRPEQIDDFFENSQSVK